MSGDVAVVDPLPLFRAGVAATLAGAGYRVETPDDVVRWARLRTRGLVLLSLSAPDDWLMLDGVVSANPECIVIALTSDESVETGTRAIQVGARSVVARAASADVLKRTVLATEDGQAVLPAAVCRALVTATATPPATGPSLSSDEISWLRDLAAGRTVARLALRAGYSERAMFRLLNALYRKLGARSRTEAIVRASELGWLRASSDTDQASG
ncbi:response regulator transcription factor [Kribbella sp. NPDC050820]|uniref:response regulator transcription factor n=1 Tax=Kribbella sp. NPDC050820 TaxID=3155408 RepID=UPI0033F22E07